MKKTIRWLAGVGGFLLLTGCSTVNVSPQTIQQNISPEDWQQLNLKLGTLQDNQPVVWHNAEGNILYTLTTLNTYVDPQGAPCRAYLFLVDAKYHRKQAVTATACRLNGQWQVQASDVQ